ncbi:MAG: biosynthetic arginine decarboxylase [Chthoniobacterales bacterium]|nr:biosynthetic arginine decarboxylase [Chthoniobacterales bacterium]
MSAFDTASATALYNVDRWGENYFRINNNGNLAVVPNPAAGTKIELMEIVNEARQRGLSFPIVVRFQDLLRDRVRTLNEAFASAISEAGYKNLYRGVFPIKVNQLREVVEEILDAGIPYHFGLEAGSKPELMAALAYHNDPESLLICNGYKDREFLRMVMLGRKLGKKIIPVAEKLEEVFEIVESARTANVEPYIGVRLRLQSKGSGKWATSSGENAKFGLSTADLVAASDFLHQRGLAHCLKLVHFHVGSQITDIVTVKRAVREAARFYAKLYKMGHELGYLDVGGGLGVDYDGSRTNFDSSMNYTLHEYTRDVVYNVMEICDAEGVPHPTLVSESGRAIVAHHSVLLIEAFSAILKKTDPLQIHPEPSDHKLVHEIFDILANIGRKNRLENLHDAQQIRDQAQSMFDLGLLELRDKAKIETVYWHVAERVVESFRGMRYIPEEVKDMEIALGDQLLCNFSVFQSLLDHWALGQLFPIIPIHRLDEFPERQGTLVDITCDSDGKVSKFIDLQDVKETLPIHRLRPGEPYYLGIFLAGAYQDIMGDLHNLFGRVNEMHIFLDEDEDCGYYVEEVIRGSTVGQVLSLTQWDTRELARRMKAQTDAALKSDKLKPNEAMRWLDEYESTLDSYTYLKSPYENSKNFSSNPDKNEAPMLQK